MSKLATVHEERNDMSRSLVVLPDDSARPMLDAINHASRSLRIKMFVFSDPAILQAVIAAHKRGVDVRVMLNPARRSGESENEESRKLLTSAGINVLDSNPSFDLTHEKSMVVDDETAFVMSFNWEPRNLTETRDYAVVTGAHHEVAEVMECFDADWERKPFTPGDHSHLIWCVGNGRQRIGQFIDEAKHTLWLQNERYQDPVIIERLVRACERALRLEEGYWLVCPTRAQSLPAVKAFMEWIRAEAAGFKSPEQFPRTGERAVPGVAIVSKEKH